jgi:hypothetical protein
LGGTIASELLKFTFIAAVSYYICSHIHHVKKNNMKKVLGFLSIIAVVALAGCSSLQTSFDYDKEADFTKYKTFEYYGWAENSDAILTRFDKERIEKAFGDEFRKRGFTFVQDGSADAVVSLFIVVDQKTGVNAYTDHYGGGYGGYYGYGYGPGWGWGYGSSTTTYQEYDYLVGTLVVDVFDREEKKLIWQGVGSGTVDDDKASEVREKNIKKTAALIMANYPIPPVKK